jgi:hypothetical protein
MGTKQNVLVTTDDLERLKAELLFELKQLINANAGLPSKKWLKSREVRELLNISHCTLQNIRSTGKLPYTKIGGVFYYDFVDIQKMLQTNKIDKLKAKANGRG